MGKTDKSKHVGNHGGGYRDMNGQHRQFTYVDHDPKIKISTTTMSEKDKQAVKESLLSYREEIIDRILGIPASLCPEPFWDFTMRGESALMIAWNEEMIKDQGMSIDRLVTLCTLLENKFGVK